MKTKISISPYGDRRWLDEHNRIHRLDGPAVEESIDSDYYYLEYRIENKPHRLNGPAWIWVYDKKGGWIINLSISYDPIMDNA